MKYLVLGCNGMAGHMVSLYLKEQGHHIIGYARKNSDIVETIVGDATDFEKVREIIEKGDYDYVVNCIGILNKDAENHKSDAILLNAYLPHFLSDVVKEDKTRIIHLSTDCVFSGKKGQYKENDLRDGETFYDRSKALGELDDNKNLTIRTSIVGPDRNEKGIGLMNWFMKQSGAVKGYKSVIWTGITTLQLAKVIDSLSGQNIVGIKNIVPQKSISKYELLKLFNKVLKKESLLIESDDTICIDKSLIPSEITKESLIIPDYQDMMYDLANWIKEKEDLYPGYYKQ